MARQKVEGRRRAKCGPARPRGGRGEAVCGRPRQIRRRRPIGPLVLLVASAWSVGPRRGPLETSSLLRSSSSPTAHEYTVLPCTMAGHVYGCPTASTTSTRMMHMGIHRLVRARATGALGPRGSTPNGVFPPIPQLSTGARPQHAPHLRRWLRAHGPDYINFAS